MENDGETADDQNSGWFEVKKKHKTSPKLFVQKPTARSFNKDQTFSPCYQASTNSETANANYREIFASTKVQLSNVSSSKVDVTRAGSVPVKRNNEQALEPQISKPTDPNGEAKVIEEVARRENIPKIKWGNLDDSVFTLHEHSQTPLCFSKAENLGCGAVSTDNFKEHGNADNLPESQSLILSYSQDTCETILRTLEGVKEFPATSLPSDMLVQSIDMNCEKVKERSSKDVNASADGNDGYDSLKANHNGCTVSEVACLLRCNNTDGENWPTPMSPVLGIVQKKVIVDLHPEIESGVITSSNLSKNDTNTRTFDLREGIHQNVHAGPETSARTSVIAAMEGQKFLQDCPTVGTDLGDNESGESKERFRQRLWCFLFESLNRAVDELYLLCELECDVEQMDEATLVLEEAISDFKDLKCRVGHFENTKRSSCQPREGMPITVKSDHRRPHALSWEVRRMTTSTQRAEILSSSLEAFKKIQMERAGKDMNKDDRKMGVTSSNPQDSGGSSEANKVTSNSTEMQASSVGNSIMVKQNTAAPNLGRSYFMLSGCIPSQNLPSAAAGKCTRELLEPICETHKQFLRKDKESSENRTEKHPKSVDSDKKQNSYIEKNKDKQDMKLWKSMDAWKEKRNWEDILKSPLRSSSRVSYSPGMNRKGVDRARVLHDKLMTPEKKKKNAADLKREAEEKHARAMRIRNQLEIERLQRLQRTSEKLNRVSEWQAVRSTKLREIMFARHQRSESLHEAYLAGVVRRAGDESSKVNEVRFITSLNEENKKLMLRQKLHDSEVRRAEKLQVIKIKLKGDIAREEAVLERKKLLEAEKLQRLAETQRKKEEAHVRREEERKASSAAREARAVEQLRRKEIRAKVQQEEAEMLAQRLAERLRESEQRRKYYLEQIREKASMDFRDQSSPLQRRCINKETQNGRSMPVNSSENSAAACNLDSDVKLIDGTNQLSIKRRIKRIRQRLMALKHEFIELSVTTENSGVGSKASVGAARVKIGRWIQELQRLRQSSKERATSIGLIVGDIIKFLEGKGIELHASRQAGLLDFIASALPASHTTKPEACQVTLYLLRLLRVVLSLPANRSYFLVQNLLPPIIPMLSTSLENYIKVAASSSSGSTNLLSSKTSCENLESVTEVLDGFLWIVSIIIGHVHFDDRQIQMQDDLMELIITYQVIHRLRDLFALYDRPLVEGSPFPSSILSSLTLLLVLTSRPGTISSIDWDSCVAKTEMINKVRRPELYDCKDKEQISVVINHSGEGKETLTSNEFVESYSDESAQPSEKEKLLSSEELLSNTLEGKKIEEANEKEIPGLSVGSAEIETVTERQVKSSSQEQKDVFEGQAKSVTTQKEEKISKNGPTERTRHDAHISCNNNGRRKSGILKQHIICLVSSISETGLVSLLSLLTAVLLQANNKLSSEQASYILPSNFEEVATGVLKVLNNLANLDITILQSMLDRPDLKVEFVHLTSFLLTHCSNKWKNTNDQVGLLLQESLLLLGYFALFHPENQAALRWGKSPTILHKVCDLPFVFFSDPELMPILAGTLVAACYGCEQNRAVVQQELSIDMLLSLLKSCKQGLPSVHVDSLVPDSSIAIDPSEGTQVTKDSKKLHSDIHVRSNRKTARILLGKGTPFSSVRNNKTKIQRDCKETKTYEQWIVKHNLPESEASSTFMLHHRFPKSFLDKAEVFFSAGVSNEQV